MADTIAGQTIHIRSLNDGFGNAYYEKDKWIAQHYLKKVRIVGGVKKFMISCLERSTWANSAAKYLEDNYKGKDVTVTLSMSSGTSRSYTGNVKILNVPILYEGGASNWRRFTIECIEQ